MTTWQDGCCDNLLWQSWHDDDTMTGCHIPLPQHGSSYLPAHCHASWWRQPGNESSNCANIFSHLRNIFIIYHNCSYTRPTACRSPCRGCRRPPTCPRASRRRTRGSPSSITGSRSPRRRGSDSSAPSGSPSTRALGDGRNIFPLFRRYFSIWNDLQENI